MIKHFPQPSELSDYWRLDPQVVFLNHGSFGACPTYLLERQDYYRKKLENQPVYFLVTELVALHQQAIARLAAFLNADPNDVVMVQNATAGVNTVFRSLRFHPGDEILFTSHIYGACRQILRYISRQTGATLVEVQAGFPVNSSGELTESILAGVTPRTRIALIDHITSATALIYPVKEIVRELEKRGVDTMIDGAHGPGAIPVDLKDIGAAFYTANCHKWLCAPKSSAILHVRKDKQKELFPLVISHAGHEAESFSERFYWPGTGDPSPVLCAGDAIGYLPTLVPDGWNGLMKGNHQRCIDARESICSVAGIEKPCPDSMIGPMATIPVARKRSSFTPDYRSFDPLQEQLRNEFHIEIPVIHLTGSDKLHIRISSQIYNSPGQYEYLIDALKELKAI